MGSNTLSTRIEEELAISTRIGKECCMYKVHELLRDVNEKAYKPTLLAIGPYHHGNVGQGFMKEHKLRHLQQMLKRTGGGVEAYITALKVLEEPARKCYAECISQTSDQFIEMMLLDGCFIIELFRKYEIYEKTRRQEEYDPIFQMKWMLPAIARDLLLFENQLPLFVLAKLFGMSESSGSRNLGEHIVDIEKKDGISVGSSTSTVQIIPTRLNDLALKFFYNFLPFEWSVDTSSYNSTKKIEYLLRLTDEALPPSLREMANKRLEFGFRFKIPEFEHLLGLIHATICISILDTEIDHAKECQEARVKLKKAILCLDKIENWIWKSIPCSKELREKLKSLHALKEIDDWNIHSATELEEAGIKIKKAEKCDTFSIKFNSGLMEISPLSIEDDTETYLRNLIAYEQYCDPQNASNYVYNYVRFMDRLINSPKDVELLRQKGIISNGLGDDEIISAMVNKLGHNVSFSTNIYARTSTNLNMHCRRRMNVWMAKLRRDYFNSPWALLSFLAAILLLALAIAQTIFSIIPYIP